ncbi:MAG TPA: DUF3618 domain-containing protein [Pseudomonas sp.]|nr:DUF3618 domain-containing protein [Pseudomonas sp.]
MSTSNSDFSANKSPEMLEREIEQKRANIDQIISALENKLSPGEIVDTALNFARGNGAQFLGNLGHSIKANPVPSLLTSIGLLWLITGQNRQPRLGAADMSFESASGPLGTVASSLAHKASDLKQQSAELKAKGERLVHKVGETLDSSRERLGNSATRVAEALKQQAQHARGSFDHLLHEQPLALGAVGIAVGALLGASLPLTRQEDRLLGATRDTLAHKAKALAEQGYEKAQGLAHEMLDKDRQETSAGSDAAPDSPSPLNQPPLP